MSKTLSYTAAYIAVKFYGLTLNPKIATFFDPFTLKFYDDVVKYLPKKLSWNHKALQSNFWKNFFVWWEELLLPGDLMHIISRKYYVEKMIKKALESGFEQIVIIGAGFDHNGALFASMDIPVFEIDTPDMTEHKKKMLKKSGYDLDSLFLCPIDPSNQNIEEVLIQSKAFDFNKKTIFLAEGFFDYLSLGSVKSILKNITNFSNDFKLISTFFNLGELNFFHRFMFTSGVAMVGETLRLPLNKKEFLELLNEFQISALRQISYKNIEEDLIAKMNVNLPVLTGFYILESEFHQ